MKPTAGEGRWPVREAGRGFTLVELMMTVALIALLTAIAVPNFMRHRRDAQRVLCLQNLDELRAAAYAYAAGHPEVKRSADLSSDLLLEAKLLRAWPTCPAGGRYSFSGNVEFGEFGGGIFPLCSLAASADHALPLDSKKASYE